MSEIDLSPLAIEPAGGLADGWPQQTYYLILKNQPTLDRTLKIRIAKQFYTTRNWVEVAEIIDKGPVELYLAKDLCLNEAVKILLELSYHHRERGDLTKYLTLYPMCEWN